MYWALKRNKSNIQKIIFQIDRGTLKYWSLSEITMVSFITKILVLSDMVLPY